MPERCQPFVAFPKGDGRSDWSREADLRTRSDPRQTSKRTGTNEVRSEAWRDKRAPIVFWWSLTGDPFWIPFEACSCKSVYDTLVMR